MKKIATITASVIIAGVLCYLGLSGYIWYYDSQRIKKNDVRLSAVAENNKVLSFFSEKRLRLLPYALGGVALLRRFSRCQTADGL